jgi:hypothetical protein
MLLNVNLLRNSYCVTHKEVERDGGGYKVRHKENNYWHNVAHLHLHVATEVVFKTRWG